MKKDSISIFLFFLFAIQFNLYAQGDSLQINVNQIPQGEIKDLDTLQLEDLFFIREGNKTYLTTSNLISGIARVSVNGTTETFFFENGKSEYKTSLNAYGHLIFLKPAGEEGVSMSLYHLSERNGRVRIRKIPLWLSILPPLIAIGLALIFREVIISLFIGIWSGAFIAGGLRIDSFYYLNISFLQTLDKYIINALLDQGHISVIVFSLLIGGMVALISKNGGMAGVVKSLSRFANSARSSQFITWALGVAIFFDDYANTLIVGNTMRSVTDKFRVSREKLAYIVDSTAAPVSAVAFITTWIGAELGYIDDGMRITNLSTDLTPYSIFLNSLKYSFYPVLTLSFVLLLIYLRKDFGGMYHAEKRARTTGQVSPALTEDDDEPNMEDLSPVKNAPLKWYNAAIPVLVVILMTIYGLLDTGISALHEELIQLSGSSIYDTSWSSVWSNIYLLMDGENPSILTKLGKIIGSADSFKSLLWASISGVSIAIMMTLSFRIMKLLDTMHWMVTGFKTMMPAIIILTLAWALAITTTELHTADFLSSALENTINPFVFPVIIFILAALISFSTGSSWSTMAILYPIAIPTSYAICIANGLDNEISMEILLNVIATVLAASVLGDHCSPISDTTILSSLASDCNHIDHVRTQLPYALFVGFISMCCVGISTFLGGGILISFILVLLSLVIFFIVIRIFGKSTAMELT